MDLIVRNDSWTIYGNKKPEVLIAGHSHIFPMFMAVQRRPKYSNYFGVASQSDFKHPLERDKSYWEFVSKNSKKRTLAIAWNGNQHNVHFLLENGERFRLFEYFEESITHPTISRDRLKELFSPTFQELKSVLGLLRQPNNVVLLGTPPPKSKKFIDLQIQNEKFFIDLARKSGLSTNELKATSDQFRIAMWKFTQDETKSIASEFGCRFIKNPTDAIDQIGLLKEEFWTEDISHANEDFGALMLDEIMLKLESEIE